MVYHHHAVTKLSELYEKYKGEIGKGLGLMYGILWKSIAPQIPDILTSLDSDPKMLEKIRNFTLEMAQAFKEDTDVKELSKQ